MKKDASTNNKIIFVFLFSLLLLVYLFLIWNNFKTLLSDISYGFGYVDYQNNWRVLDDFIKLKIPYKDYFYEYGWFFIFIQSIGYIIFGKNFLAILITDYLYLPIISVVLSYILAKNILGEKKLIIIFLFFVLLFRTNYDYTSIRHLMAELSLSFFILYLLQDRNKYLLTSGIFGGLAVITSLEYGLALNVTILFIFSVSHISDIKFKKVFSNKFLLGELIIVGPYFFWLYIEGALRNYWESTYSFIKNFYYISPCTYGSFPRFSEIQTPLPDSKLLVFNVPIEFLQRLNFYLVFIFFLISLFVLLIIFIKNKEFSKDNLIKLSLITYGLLIFIRTLDTTCLPYFVYGLVPFFLLITLLIGEIASWSCKNKSLFFKIIGFSSIIIIFSWFILTENTGTIVQIFGENGEQMEKNAFQEQEFFSPAGWYINKEFAEEYNEISDYIIKNTTENDFLYVYPWGPYNHLTGRKSPNSITNSGHFLYGGLFTERTKSELESKKPKFVVINIYNNLGIATYGKTRGDVSRYFSLGYEDGPVFVGEGNEVEKYIIENYKVVFKNNLAIVMQQRTTPLTIDKNKKMIFSWVNWETEDITLESMKKTNSPGKYAITGKNASLSLIFENPIKASDISIELKLNGNLLTKHLTKYILNFYIQTTDANQSSFVLKTLASKDWQTIEIPVSGSKEIKKLKIELGPNIGLIWWFNPDVLEIKKVTFFE